MTITKKEDHHEIDDANQTTTEEDQETIVIHISEDNIDDFQKEVVNKEPFPNELSNNDQSMTKNELETNSSLNLDLDAQHEVDHVDLPDVIGQGLPNGHNSQQQLFENYSDNNNNNNEDRVQWVYPSMYDGPRNEYGTDSTVIHTQDDASNVNNTNNDDEIEVVVLVQETCENAPSGTIVQVVDHSKQRASKKVLRNMYFDTVSYFQNPRKYPFILAYLLITCLGKHLFFD